VAIDEILARKREAEATLDAVREEMSATEGEFLCDLFAPLFAENPEVVAFQWRQYTPYFNDGDPCAFGSYHEDGDILVYPDGYDPDPDDGPCEEDAEPSDDLDIEDGRFGRLDAARVKFQQAVSVLTDDDMECLFGDDQMVTVYRDRVECEEYNPG